MTFKIYTKTGDKGETALYGGTRVSKASARVDAYGTIDELNAFIGIAKSHIDDSDCLKQLAEIQYDLFTLGSEAATPIDKVYLANGKSRLPVTIKEEDISKLEVWMDKMDESLEPLQFFILPGGGKAATFLHAARTICRRAERGMVFLNETEEVRPELIKYLNRLSDYLFVMARYASMLDNEQEEYWNPNAR
ncbi:cob(I)yrinic acid a,c-diamide adenosyltransferase [Elizabethkingia occulta]|jgi:cob(I)alamin adenosyltransferase|uniref:Corrinoid adenosyltransferase n=3 Tax=Elizabethkingia TaxID=308865 RepID=A0ABD5BAC4_ELIMR|nr:MULTISPECIES: cob(I)yrinic acid a,c-diamide adenosyltransferase [Elizabethkingia]MDR2229265.1 cob(I)yrinic acid a,c-diamide adenosyltransferase [Flavobacteriaceae bacterium]AQX08188.1 ATP:cob(I)alamin adenosyltransferase [Elizabethkingia ursingii]KUY27476.1 cob(I)yrinic acid a c-diamide adenosyltransferase [Elizabethkingia ursingii]MCL1665384.1 cob(I)yrinic acid a,c-diamide adenosyltransferase [Elizabethkingia ursingii]MCL1669924.1 cob(I)yrinic acid a,c-diamide adenosyltransferase [Elizabet